MLGKLLAAGDFGQWSSFLPLGLYLATLYDHLEQLGVRVDVFEAFRTALGRA